VLALYRRLRAPGINWRVIDTEDIVQEDTFIHFEARVEKINLAGQPTRPVLKVGNTFNLHGPHSRVNIQSLDSSVNISHHVSENVFADIRQVVQTQVQNEEERTQILNNLNELEAAKGTDTFTQKYQSFIASAANHMTLLAPFMLPLSVVG
jgi:Flp pilus assembly secretin CpaC